VNQQPVNCLDEIAEFHEVVHMAVLARKGLGDKEENSMNMRLLVPGGKMNPSE